MKINLDMPTKEGFHQRFPAYLGFIQMLDKQFGRYHPYWFISVSEEHLLALCEAYAAYPGKTKIKKAKKIPDLPGKDAQCLRDAYRALDDWLFTYWVID